MLTALKRRLFPQPRAQPVLAEGPIQFTMARRIAQHRHAFPVAGFQIRVVIDEHTVELRRANLRQQGQSQIAQMAVVALVEDEGQDGGSATVCDGSIE